MWASTSGLVSGLTVIQAVARVGGSAAMAPSCSVEVAGDLVGGGLGHRADDHEVDVDMRGAGDGPDDAVGDVVGGQGLDTGVDVVGPGPVAGEAGEGELGLDHPGGDLGGADGLTVELQAQGVGDGPDGVLGGGVAGAAGVDLEAGDGAEVDDVGAGGGPQQGQERPGDPQQADHVGVQRGLPVVVAALGHRVEAEGGAGVVDQQVGVAVAVADGGGEGVDRGRVGDVQGQGGGADLLGQGGEAVGAAGAGDHVEAGPGQLAGAGRPIPLEAPVTTAIRSAGMGETLLSVWRRVDPLGGE